MDYVPSEIKIIAGSSSLNENHLLLDVENFIIHENYDHFEDKSKDVAIIKVKNKIFYFKVAHVSFFF